MVQILNQSAVFGFDNEFLGYYSHNRHVSHNWALSKLESLKEEGVVTQVGFEVILFLYRSMRALYDNPEEAIIMEIANIQTIDDLRFFPEFMGDNDDIAELELGYDTEEAEELWEKIINLEIGEEMQWKDFKVTVQYNDKKVPEGSPLYIYKVSKILADAEVEITPEIAFETGSEEALHIWLIQQ